MTSMKLNNRVLVYFTSTRQKIILFYEGWNFNSGNYLFTTDTK